MLDVEMIVPFMEIITNAEETVISKCVDSQKQLW